MTHRTLISFGIAFILFVAVGAAYGVWYHIVTRESAELAALASEIADRTNDTERTTGVKSSLRTLFVDEEAIAGYFLSPDDAVPFLERLEGAGQPFGARVSVASVSLEDAVSAQGIALGQRLVISLTITGSFDALVRTIGVIEYGPYDMLIANLALNSSIENKQRKWVATGIFSAGIHASARTKTAAETSLP